MKFFRLPLSALLLVVATCSARAGGVDQVTAQVRAFYQWYIPLLESDAQDKEVLKKHRQEMSRYVTANLLAKIARIKSDSQEGDYFLESLDDDRDWAKNIKISNVKIDAKGRATADVLMLGNTESKVSVKVTLVLEGGTYKISAVEGLPDLSGIASAQLRAFYAQYLHYLAHAVGFTSPMELPDVQKGFTKEGLAKATAKGAGDAKTDYLLQAPDWDLQWEDHVEVKRAEITPDGTRGTAEVLLTGGTANAHLKVSLKHEGDTFKIDSVEKLGD